MANEKWLSGVAKSGEYKDLINKPTIVTDIDYDASENSLASSKSVKIVYDKAEEALNKANESKAKIATSLNAMGVTTDENDTFESLSEKIKTIKTGVNTDDATATADKMLMGVSAYVKGKKINGSMLDNGAVNVNITAGQKYNIPIGYHNGSGIVISESLEIQGASKMMRGTSPVYSEKNPDTPDYYDVYMDVNVNFEPKAVLVNLPYVLSGVSHNVVLFSTNFFGSSIGQYFDKINNDESKRTTMFHYKNMSSKIYILLSRYEYRDDKVEWVAFG